MNHTTRALNLHDALQMKPMQLLLLAASSLIVLGCAPAQASQFAGESSPPPKTPTAIPTQDSEPKQSATATPTINPSPTPTVFASGAMIIGTSVAGRPIEIIRFGNGPVQRLIVAGIHGGYEWNTIALARQLIEHIQDNPKIIPAEVELYILPAFNPDGQARSRYAAGRANENGVDLNRNWPTFWQSEWPRAGCWNTLPITAGEFPGSEPEVSALMTFIQSKDLDALISYHSAALGIFPGGKPPDPRSLKLAEAIAQVSPYPYPPIDIGCLYSGQFADWASANVIAAVDVELSTHNSLDFEINLEILKTFLAWRP